MKKGAAGIILIVVFAAALVLGTLTVWQLFNKPLAEPLAVKMQEAPTVVPSTNSDAAAQPTSEAVCGQTGSTYVLVVGYHEAGEFAYQAEADVIRLVKVDFDQKKASAFAFPRDLVVQAPALNQSDIRLGDVFQTVFEKEGSNEQAVPKALSAVAQSLYDTYGLRVDHYIAPQSDKIEEIVDILGGVDVQVAKPFKSQGKGFETLDLPAGLNRLNGSAALTYARFPNSEWERSEHYNAVFQGAAQKVKESSVYDKIPELYEKIKDMVLTDMSLAEITNLACATREIVADPDNIQTAGFKEADVVINGLRMTIKDANAAKKMIEDTFAN